MPVQSTDLATRYSTKGGSKTVGAGGSKTTAVTVPTQTDSADAEVTDVADVGGQVTQTSASSAATPTGVTSSNDAGRVVGGSAALGLGVMFMGATFVL